MIRSIHLARHHVQILFNTSNQYFHGIFQTLSFQSEHFESLKHILQIETSQKKLQQRNMWQIAEQEVSNSTNRKPFRPPETYDL